MAFFTLHSAQYTHQIWQGWWLTRGAANSHVFGNRWPAARNTEKKDARYGITWTCASRGLTVNAFYLKMELSLIQYNLHLAIVRGRGINVTCHGIGITCHGILKDLVIGQHICYVDRIN